MVTRHDIYKTISEHEQRDIDSDEKEFSESVGGFKTYIKAMEEQRFAKDFVSDIALPGHSSDGKVSCGKFKIIGDLNDHGLHESGKVYMKKAILSCNSKGCVKCFETAVKREAKQISDRMVTFANLKSNRKIYLKKNRVRILSHVSVSVPLDQHYKVNTPEGRKELRATQLKLLKSLDVDGGVTVFHPYRFSHELESARVSPHFHNIITGWIDGAKVKAIYEQTGWIIKQISTLDTVQEAYSLSAYLLSHAGVFERSPMKRSSEHSVSYFGECQNRKFKVSSILTKSITGYDQLDEILFSKREKKSKNRIYKLQSVHYTLSTIQDSIKNSNNEYHMTDGSINGLSKTLRQYVNPHRDNPALSQSETEHKCQEEPFTFLQMRFDYGDSPLYIVQSEYVNIVFDSDIDTLCPECSAKLRTLVPVDWGDEQKSYFAEVIFPMLNQDVCTSLDSDLGFQYLSKFTMSPLGMPFVDVNGLYDNDTGILSKPKCIDDLNPTLRTRINRSIDLQTFKYQYKIQNGMNPSKEEQIEFLTPTVKRSTNNHSLLDY